MPGRRTVLALALVVLPSVAFAQRTRTQAATGRDKDLMSDAGKSRPTQITVRDLEEQSPIKLLIDKRKDLKLADAQVSQMKDAESKLKEKNSSLFRIVDSLNQRLRPPSGGEMTDDMIAKQRDARQELASTILDIRNNYDAAAKEVLPTLDEEQQKKAGDLVEKQKADAEKLIRERMGRGGRP